MEIQSNRTYWKTTIWSIFAHPSGEQSLNLDILKLAFTASSSIHLMKIYCKYLREALIWYSYHKSESWHLHNLISCFVFLFSTRLLRLIFVYFIFIRQYYFVSPNQNPYYSCVRGFRVISWLSYCLLYKCTIFHIIFKNTSSFKCLEKSRPGPPIRYIYHSFESKILCLIISHSYTRSSYIHSREG
jgi:hypothetical protein